MTTSLLSRIPSIQTLQSQFIPDNSGYDLLIILDNEDISLREFSAFLMIVDRFYGRFIEQSFYSYAMSEKKHLTISKIENGSAILIIEDILSLLHKEDALILYFLITFLPSAINSVSSSIKKLSTAYDTYEKARLKREIRKSLKTDLKNSEELKTLNEKDLSKLTELLEKKYLKEQKYIAKASKFASKKLKKVEFKKKK